MANDYLAVADLVAFAAGLGHNELLELKAGAPLLAQLPAIESSDGITHKYTKTTQLPVTGFRAENDGREVDHSIDTTVTETLKIYDWSFDVDKAVADSRGRDRVMSREETMHIRSALFGLEKQIIYGTGNDSAGFSGWANSADLNQAADEMVLDAGGSTANEGTSCYLIRASETEVASVYMGDQLTFSANQEIVIIQKAGATGFYPAYYKPGCGNFAAQIGTKYSIARIASIHPTDSNAQLTDELIYNAWSLFPAGVNPTHIVMNRSAQKMLRNSRTATNATGAPAPYPTDVGGVPIVVTDAITSTEAML